MKNIYIPVEVKARGWTAKLLLSQALANMGFRVIIGEHGFVQNLALQDFNGIYIEKDFFYLRTKIFEQLKERGFLLYAYDEEGLVYLQKHMYVDTRTHKDFFEMIDGAFTWGNEQTNILTEAYPMYSSKFIQAGNPRIDIITNNFMDRIYKKEIRKIKDYGHYILLNSNFTSIDNPAESAKQDVFINKTHGEEDRSSKYEALLKDYFSFEKEIFALLIKDISILAENTDKKIVIRTHPSERTDKWEKLLCYKNISITSKYDANPWIYCADAIVHHGCTTGIEGYLMKKRVVSYSPIKSTLDIESLPDQVSYLANNGENLIELLSAEGIDKSVQKDSIINDHILLRNGKGYSVNVISKCIKKGCEEINDGNSDSMLNSFSNHFYLQDYIMGIKNSVSNTSGRKFSYESHNMLKNRLMCIGNIGDDSITTKHIGKNVFVVEHL